MKTRTAPRDGAEPGGKMPPLRVAHTRYHRLMLHNVPFFQGLSETELKALEQVGRTEHEERGSVIFAEGDTAESLYVILSGGVGISRDEDGRRVELSTLGAGDFFGELALFDGAPRSATATALEPSELFVLAREAFLDFLPQSPEMLTHVLSAVSSRMRGVNEKFLLEIVAKERVRTEMERERYRSLSQMVAGVAHEINTPLGIVNIAASIIADSLSSEAVSKYRSDPAMATMFADLQEASTLIQGNLARANKLVQSFKNLSVAQVTDQREQRDLGDIVDEIVTLFGPQARRAHLEVAIRRPDTPLQWTGYPGFLGQILLNLLSNAERYAYPGDSGGKIDLVLKDALDEGFRITVRDFGAGMSESDRSRVFEPFFTTGRSQGGTGLGMAIVHNLVTTALRGTIEIDSELGKGTTVTLTLPREVPEPEGNAGGVPAR
ncbi:MAG TPA: cyclic nucleotide-binding domain-containing protein [Thermoanaerobaculia bacterium]|nr:cyclic nucleotide-binding domain-containing protein [Thermoanaerobaculia bacterium]